MIDWDAPGWGDNVHEDSHGSWVPDRHRDDAEEQ